MITFNTISIKLMLADSTGRSTSGLSVTFQYYSFASKSWVNLYQQALDTKGNLSIRKTAGTGMPPEEVTFFEAIQNEKMPPVRIIPTDPVGNLTKQPVIGSTFSFQLLEASSTFEFNFGALALVPEVLITDARSPFKEFIVITSFYKSVIPMDNTPLPINELYTNIVSEIETATAASGSSAFKLSNMSLKLKALIQRDGDIVNASLLDLDNADEVNGNAISELVFDITPVRNEETAPALIPDVTGLTETAVRRVLKSLNLRLNPVYQNNSEVVNGDSFRQSPAARQPIQPNQLVTVIFSKHG